MRSAQISFTNKKILIIGGGKQALKKGHQFKAEGAKVTFMALTMIDAIKREHCIHKAYEQSALKDVFLVYACTDDKTLNHQIVLDANEEGILSASVNQDREATYHPLQYQDYPHLHVALSTNGSYPAYMHKLFSEIEENYYKGHHNILKKLHFIRKYILQLSLEQDEKMTLLRTIEKASYAQIHFYEQAIQKQKVMIAVFHGNETMYCTMMIEQFLNAMKWNDASMYYAFLNVEENSAVSLQTIAEHMNMLKIKQVNYQFMLTEKGYCFQKMMETLQVQKVEDLLIDESNVNEVLDEYAQCEQGILVVHHSKTGEFSDLLKKHCPAHLHVMMLNDDLPNLDRRKPITLSGVFMLAGTHLNIDVMSEKGILGKLKTAGYTVVSHQACLLQMQSFQKLFKRKLETIQN